MRAVRAALCDDHVHMVLIVDSIGRLITTIDRSDVSDRVPDAELRGERRPTGGTDHVADDPDAGNHRVSRPDRPAPAGGYRRPWRAVGSCLP